MENKAKINNNKQELKNNKTVNAEIKLKTTKKKITTQN